MCNSSVRRFRRLEYWAFMSVNGLIAYALNALAGVFLLTGDVVNFGAVIIVAGVISLPTAVLQYIALKKRMNDVYKDPVPGEKKPFASSVGVFKGAVITVGALFVSVLFMILPLLSFSFVPLAAIGGIAIYFTRVFAVGFSIALLVFSFFDSKPLPNRYGDNPKNNYIKQTKVWQTVTLAVLVFVVPMAVSLTPLPTYIQSEILLSSLGLSSDYGDYGDDGGDDGDDGDDGGEYGGEYGGDSGDLYTPSGNAKEYYDSGVEHYNAGEYDKAIEDFGDAKTARQK